MSIQISNKLEEITTLAYVGELIESIMYDKEHDNYFLCIREKDDEFVNEALFYSEPRDIALLITSKITRDDFLRKSKHRYKINLEYDEVNNVYMISNKYVIRNIDYFLTFDKCFLYDNYHESNLSLECFMKYSYVLISGKGIKQFLESLDK